MSNNSLTPLTVLLLFVCANLFILPVKTASYITLDCNVVGNSECERLLSLTQGNSAGINAKSMEDTKSQDTGKIVAITIGSLTACVLVVAVAIIVLSRRKKQKLLQRNQKFFATANIPASGKSVWNTSTASTPISALSENSLNFYPHEEEVLFRLDVLEESQSSSLDPPRRK